MSLANHNGGNFKLYRAKNDPEIRSYDDAYSFLVEDPHSFKLEDAVRIHIFDLKIRESIHKIENIEKKVFTKDDIDQFIERVYGAKELCDVITKAKQTISEYKEGIETNAFQGLTQKIPKRHGFLVSTLIGAWHGVCGNAISFCIILHYCPE